MAFFRHRHVTGFPGFPDRRKERDVIVTSLSLPGHGPARVFAERLPMCKAMAHHWGAHKARPAQLLRTWPRAKQWIFQWLEGRERDVAITSLSQVIGKANGMVRTPQASRQRQSHCRAKALCEAVQPCALHARTKGVQLSSNSPSALQKRARSQNRAVKGLR